MSRTYTDQQVRALMYAYYCAGRYTADIAELHAIWTAYDEPHATWEQRVAQRVDDMERHAQRLNARLGRPPGYEYRGGPVDWETGAPVRRHLEVAA